MKGLLSKAMLLILGSISVQVTAMDNAREEHRITRITIKLPTRIPQRWDSKVKIRTGDQGLSKKVKLRVCEPLPVFKEGVRNFLNHDTPKLLNVAVAQDDLPSVRALLARGAKVNGMPNESAPLHVATSLEMVRLLLEYKANADVTDDDGFTLLKNALNQKNRNWTLIETLLAYGADYNVKTEDGRSLLDLACFYQQQKIMQFLVRNGVKLNVLNKRGRTPLHYACLANDKTAVEFLLAAGADPFIQDKDGLFAINSVKAKNVDLIEMLEQRMAQLSKQLLLMSEAK